MAEKNQKEWTKKLVNREYKWPTNYEKFTLTKAGSVNEPEQRKLEKTGQFMPSSTFDVMPQQWYQPGVTPESWLMPKNYKQTIAWIKAFSNDPYVSRVIKLKAFYPLSRFKLVHKDKSIVQFFEDMIHNPSFEIDDFLQELAIAWQKFGEIGGSGQIVKNSEGRSYWKKVVLHDPEVLEIVKSPFDESIIMNLEMTSETLKEAKRLMKSDKQEDQQKKKALSQAIVSAVESGKNYITLNMASTEDPYKPATSFYQSNNYNLGERGAPNILSTFKALMKKDKLNKAQVAMADRHSCLTGDTKIALLDGTTSTIEELYKKGATDFYVYSIDGKSNLVPGLAQKVVCNGSKEVVRVTLDDGSSFKCTPDHRLLLRNNIYKEAKDCVVQESLMPLYKKFGKISRCTYEQIYNPATDKWVYTHVQSLLFTDRTQFKLKGKRNIHHIDKNPRNNEPTNLQMMSLSDHKKIHLLDPETKKKFLDGSKLWRQNNKEYISQVAKKNADSPTVLQARKTMVETYMKDKNWLIKRRQEWEKAGGLEKQREGMKKYWTEENREKQAAAVSNKRKEDSAKEFEHNKNIIIGKLKQGNRYSEETLNTYNITQVDGEYLCFARNVLKPSEQVGFLPGFDTGIRFSSEDERDQLIKKYVDERVSMKKIAEMLDISYDWLRYNLITKPKREQAVLNHKIVSVEKCGVESVYDIINVDKWHNFAILTSELSGVVVSNCPLELWTVGHITGNPETDIIPDEDTLSKIREMIKQATFIPPFSIIYTPLLKYEAVGITGKLLNIAEDMTFIENEILIGMGINKNVLLADGPSFSSSTTMALHALVMELQTDLNRWERWIKNFLFLPICKLNGWYEKVGNQMKYKVPEIEWEKSMDVDNANKERETYYKLWKDGGLSTKTLFSKFPELKYETEQEQLEAEKGTIFDSHTRLPTMVTKKKESTSEIEKPKPGASSVEKPTPVAPVKPEKPRKVTKPKVEEEK